jgi:putative ABC transport system ATP-binding protein
MTNENFDQKDIVIKTVGLTKTYGKQDALVKAVDNVSVDIYAGQLTQIMGASGSGKTTILQIMAGLDSATSGETYIDNNPISTLSDKELTKLRREVGFIFQSYNLLPMFTAEENIKLPAMLAKRKVDEKWMETLVKTLNLQDRLKHLPSELSGGQQQRVAIARALILKPKIIFADEPTGNLDTVSGLEVISYLRQAVDNLKVSVVMVTHDLSSVKFADRTLFIADGKIYSDLQNPTEQAAAEIQKEIRNEILGS